MSGGRGTHTYFVQAVDGGLIKIGATTDPIRRLQLIQACSPVRLRILGVMWNRGWLYEQDLHRDFDDLREYGEWFRPAPELLAYIAEHATGEGDEQAAS
jgi:hypothetical protein